MADLLATSLGDLVVDTLRDLGKPKFTEITTDIQQFTAMPQLLKKNRVSIQGGYGVQWNVMVNHAQSAANVGLGYQDNPNIIDTTVQATADWRNSKADYAFIGQEISMNREPARIVDLVRQRRIAAMIALVELMENNFWGPPVGASDNTTPWGINTWIVKNASVGFNGGAPTGYTTIGLNPSTYPRWKNYSGNYTAVSSDDLVRKWRKMATFINFRPPVDGIPTFNTGNMWRWYTNYGVIGPLEEILESQNDNLGNDVASKDGLTMFRRSPVQWVPKLEDDTTNPVYGLNWGVFKTYILSGWWLKQTNIQNYPGQHTISAYFLDCTYQWVLKDRRCHGVLATGTSYPS